MHDNNMPTTTCARCTGNGSTLGPLGKHRRVGVDPAPGWDNADLPVLPRSESRKLSGNACSEGGNEAGYYSLFLATLIHTFYTPNRWSVH